MAHKQTGYLEDTLTFQTQLIRMRISIISMLITGIAIATTPEERHVALQMIEERYRKTAKTKWTQSSKAIASGKSEAGHMAAGFHASSISQTLQKTVGRPGTERPDKRIVIELGDHLPVPSRTEPPRQPVIHPNFEAHVQRVAVTAQTSHQRLTDIRIGRLNYNIGRNYYALHGGSQPTNEELVRLSRLSRQPLANIIKQNFNKRITHGTPKSGAWVTANSRLADSDTAGSSRGESLRAWRALPKRN